jgi:hypothetical protein
MAKFFGPIGFAITTETRPGVWKDQIEERDYIGDVIRDTSRWAASSDSTNDDLTLNNQISIVADPFALNHFHTMKYIRFGGTNWKITGVEQKYPRLILTIGGVYNGSTKS